MGNQKKLPKTKKDPMTKKEKKFKKVEQSFNNCTLSREDLCKIPGDKELEYLKKMIAKKFKTDEIDFRCSHCGHKVLYSDSGYITDEDLLCDEMVSKNFRHM